MRNQIIFSLFFIAAGFMACKNNGSDTTENTAAPAPDSPAQTTSAATIDPNATGTYAVDTEASSIQWIGSKAAGSSHNGTLKLQGGELSLYQGNITGGNVTIDMNSINVEGLDADGKGKLEGHLKSPDFFDTAKFPTASFKFGSTTPLTGDASGASQVVGGELTVKGIAKPIRIPFNYSFSDGKVIIESAPFSIIRTEWGVQYKSGILGTIKDEIINDEIKLKLKLVAAPAAN